MINFANKSLPSYIKVRSVQHSILPPINHKTASVLGRAGAYDFGVDLGMRTITVDIQIIADHEHDIMSKATDLASWLFYETLQPLIFDDEPDKQYMARIVGDTELAEIYRTGEGSLEFVCPDAYKESTGMREITASPTQELSLFSVSNNGTASTFPLIELTLREDATALAVTTAENYVLLGQSSAEKTTIDDNPLILKDTLASMAGWTTGINTDNGIVAGTMVSVGDRFVVQNKDYGTGSAYHGASVIKSLPKQLQDFEVSAYFGYVANNVNQLGRVELYMLDANNVAIGKMAIFDTSTVGDFPRVEGRAGTWETGHYFALSEGSKKGIWSKVDPGKFNISRKGNLWTFTMGRYLNNGKFTQTYEKKWIDRKLQYQGKVAKIMLHIGAYKAYQPVNNMYFSDLRVWDRSVTVDDASQVGTPFKAGDKVLIDNGKAEVLLNGEPIYRLLNTSSSFFALEKGSNILTVSPPIADVNLKYRERWL